MLTLKKGGHLFASEWNTKTRSYDEVECTESAIRHLFTWCKLDEDITLSDVLLLLNSNIEVFEAVLGNWCSELVAEGLAIHAVVPEDKERIEYLELYWSFAQEEEEESEKISFYGHNFPQFHGVGVLNEEDKFDKWENQIAKKGDRNCYAIEMTPIYKLSNIPLKLSGATTIYNEDLEEVSSLENVQFTLGHILYGIVWELSFCGPPSSRDQMREELNEMVEEIHNGTAELIDIKELLKSNKTTDTLAEVMDQLPTTSTLRPLSEEDIKEIAASVSNEDKQEK